MKQILLFPLFFLLFTQASGQSQTLSSRILDEQTKEPLPFAHIALNRDNVGTSSNLEGNFILKLSNITATDSIGISFIGYQTIWLPASGLPKEILLVPASNELNEVVITDLTAKETVLKAFRLVPKNYPDKSTGLEGFFRETVQQDGDFLAFVEAVQQVSKTSYAQSEEKDRVENLKGRNMLDSTQIGLLENVNMRGGGKASINFDLVKSRYFNEKNVAYFNFEFDGYTRYQGRAISIISFKRKPDAKHGSFDGKIYIDLESFGILRMELVANPQGLADENKKLRRKNRLALALLRLKLEKTHRTLSVDYQLHNGKWTLLGAQYHLTMKVHEGKIDKNSVLDYQVSFLTTKFLEQAPVISASNDIGKRDIAYSQIMQITYDDAFWENYNFLPATKAEKAMADRLAEK